MSSARVSIIARMKWRENNRAMVKHPSSAEWVIPRRHVDGALYGVGALTYRRYRALLLSAAEMWPQSAQLAYLLRRTVASSCAMKRRRGGAPATSVERNNAPENNRRLLNSLRAPTTNVDGDEAVARISPGSSGSYFSALNSLYSALRI